MKRKHDFSSGVLSLVSAILVIFLCLVGFIMEFVIELPFLVMLLFSHHSKKRNQKI
ncbi:hypothetical protein ACFL9U_00930 [Thermodesulfobacteriota bacterium]